jgi:hypothetical protein
LEIGKLIGKGCDHPHRVSTGIVYIGQLFCHQCDKSRSALRIVVKRPLLACTSNSPVQQDKVPLQPPEVGLSSDGLPNQQSHAQGRDPQRLYLGS